MPTPPAGERAKMVPLAPGGGAGRGESTSGFALRLLRSRLALVVLVGLPALCAVVLRGVDISRQVYSNNETYTPLFAAGFLEDEATRLLIEGGIVTADDVQRFQRLDPGRGMLYVPKALAQEDPHHPPLYFLLVRGWLALFSDWGTVRATRALSVFFSLLGLPAFYWLARELFDRRRTAWILVALMAVSPFHFLYSRHARSYAFLTLLIVISSAAILRAIRGGGLRWWAIYAALVCCGLYTHFFLGFVAIGHVMFCLILERRRGGRCLRPCLVAVGVAGCCILPWLYYTTLRENAANTSFGEMTRGEVLKAWGDVLTRVFIDFDIEEHPRAAAAGVIGTAALAGTALWCIVRRGPPRGKAYLLTQILAGAGPLMLIDILSGGMHSFGGPLGMSTQGRYILPAIVALQLAVAWLASSEDGSGSEVAPDGARWQPLLRGLLPYAVVWAGFASCLVVWRERVWWHNPGAHPEAAAVLNASRRPLLVSEARFREVASMSYQADAHVRFQVIAGPEAWAPPDSAWDLFLLRPSHALREAAERARGCPAEAIPHRQSGIWYIPSSCPPRQ